VQLADEAEEMWSGDHEAPVPEAEWPSAHLQMILGMHRDEEREALLAEQRRSASEIIDGLEPARRALLCWRFHTTVQRRVVALLTAATVRATEEGLVKTTSFTEAAQRVADFEIGLQIDEIEDHYYHGGDARRLGDGRDRVTDHGSFTRLGESTDGRGRQGSAVAHAHRTAEVCDV
jgi:hypothetical protein